MKKRITIIAIIIVLLTIFNYCGDNSSDEGTKYKFDIKPGSTINFPDSTGEIITVTATDSNNDGVADGIDFNGDGIGDTSIIIDPTGSTVGIDIDNDGTADYHAIIDENTGTITINTAADGTGTNVTVITNDEGTGLDTNDDGIIDVVIIDKKLPVISELTHSELTLTNATITWKTDENTTSQVVYGTASDLSEATTYPTSDTTADNTSHNIALSGLTADTIYYYKAICKDTSNNKAESTITSFKTLSLPVISNVAHTNVTATSATITWTTNKNTTSQVVYGTAIDLSGATTYPVSDTKADSTSHSINLTGLNNPTKYYYK